MYVDFVSAAASAAEGLMYVPNAPTLDGTVHIPQRVAWTIASQVLAYAGGELSYARSALTGNIVPFRAVSHA